MRIARNWTQPSVRLPKLRSGRQIAIPQPWQRSRPLGETLCQRVLTMRLVR